MQKREELVDSSAESRIQSIVQWIGRFVGPLLAILMYAYLPQGVDGLSDEGRATAAIGALMAVLWMTEALPLPITALLPLVLFPLTGVFPIEQAAGPYANPIIFLFMGGFMIALAIERWNLHLRLALLTVLAVGTKPTRLIGGFMIATAFLSMWISNTATTVMMLPIGLSVITLLANRLGQGTGIAEPDGCESKSPGIAKLSGFPICLMLGIAYAASIGGVGTLVGTPPNLVLAGFLKDTYGVEIGFGRWMLFGVPFVIVFLFITWVVLTRLIYPVKIQEIPGGAEEIRRELKNLGSMSRGEWTVLCVFVMTAVAWVLREPLQNWVLLKEHVPAIKGLSDANIALIGALLLFVIPVDAKNGTFALDWKTAIKLPWGVLLLFGGGLSLAAAVSSTGITDCIGKQSDSLDGLPIITIMVVLTAVVIFLTELMSNTATATAFLPILGGVATGIGADPLLLLVPATLAASCAFMLPVATPPNAIVFSAGHVTIGQMVKAGLVLNLIGVLLIPLLMYFVGVVVFGIRM